jgi:hypothetical protein
MTTADHAARSAAIWGIVLSVALSPLVAESAAGAAERPSSAAVSATGTSPTPSCDPPTLDFDQGELAVLHDVFAAGGTEVLPDVAATLLERAGFTLVRTVVGAAGMVGTIMCAFELGVFDTYRSELRVPSTAVVPTATMVPATVAVGGSTTAQGCGWIPDRPVRITQHGPGVTGGGATAEAGSDGCISVGFQIASSTSPGIVIGLLFSQDVPSNYEGQIVGTNHVPTFLAVTGRPGT